jgi:cGMP-dependent 3',5'-cyclic phosphodiesterase
MQIPTDEEGALAKREVPSCEAFNGRMSELIFSPRSIPDVDTPLAVISMMKDMGLIQRWKIPRNKLAKFVLMVKKGYRNPPYHNWMHAFCVAHFSYTLFKQCNGLKCISELELLALFVSCLCHDIDHRGTNNAFQVSSNSVLASLYSSQGSVMERHHISQTMSILNTEDCDIFQNLTADEYRSILDLIYDIILATDLSLHLSIINELEKMSMEGYDSSNPHHHHLLRSLLMTSCDLSACLKDWDDSVAVSKLIYSEFFSQGDKVI